MAGPLLYDRVLETTAVVGTGTATLLGAVAGFQTFAVVGNGNTCPYAIWEVDSFGNPDGDWESGIGTYTASGTTLARTKVLQSSNANALVSFAGGTKRVALDMSSAFLLTQNAVCNGRLTTETGVPVSTTDRTAQGTIYFTPYNGNRVALWNGSGWQVYPFPELSYSVSATAGQIKDLFGYDNAGTLTLEASAAWTNDTTRTDALALQDGIWCKSGALTRRWLGTFRASGSNVTADSGGNAGTTQVGGQRFVWNRYNQVLRNMKVRDTVDSYTYAGGIRQMNGAAGNKVEWVTGDAATDVEAICVHSSFVTNSAGGVYASAGIGLDSTTVFSGGAGQVGLTTSVYVIGTLVGDYSGQPGLGYHYLSFNEAGDGVSSGFYGDNAGICQSNLKAWFMG